MGETEAVAPHEPFLQGDVIELINARGDAADPNYGIIINADCDLAHCKIDGVVAYIPLFPFERYFENFWIPTFIETRRRELVETVAQRCSIGGDAETQLCGWLLEEPVEDVASKISSTYKIKIADLTEKLSELATIARAKQYDWPLLDALLKLQEGKRDDILARHARRALKNLGEGHFFINEVVGLDTLGFVARMRRIYSVNSDCIFSVRSEFIKSNKNGDRFAIRIAKLTNLYRFKIAQLFGMQFSRIGLPDEITSLNEIAVQAAVSNLRDKNA